MHCAPDSALASTPSAVDDSSPDSAAQSRAAKSRPKAATAAARSAQDLALITSFAALIAACALAPSLTIGGLVPITLQTFAVLLAGATLGARRGLLTVLLYLAIGAIGVPVFAQGAAGIGPFTGPTAGYLLAFPLAAGLTGLLAARLPKTRGFKNVTLLFFAGFISSLLLIHPLGILGLSLRGGMSLHDAFIFDLVFIPGDIIKNIAMAIVAAAVHRAFPSLLKHR